MNPPVNYQTDRVWSVSKKRQKAPGSGKGDILPSTSWSPLVCAMAEKGRLHFIPDNAKVNSKLHCEIMLTRLVEDCKSLLPSGFIFQEDGTPANTAKLAQNWIAINCSDFIEKKRLATELPDLNPLDYHVWGAMLERNKTHQPKPNTIERRRKSCKQYGMIYQRTPSTRPYWASSKDFELVWKLGRTLWARLQINCDSHSLKCQIYMFRLIFNTCTIMKIVIFIVVVLRGSVVVSEWVSE